MDSKPEASDKKGDETEKKDWAEMSDDDAENENAGANEEVQAKPEPEPKKIIPPTQKGTKNKQGDYIVEKFEIPDFRDGLKKKNEDDSDEDESSSDDYGNEEEDANKVVEEQPKKEGKNLNHNYKLRLIFISIVFVSLISLSCLNDP